MQEASDATPSGMVSILGSGAGPGRGALRQGPRRRDPGDRQPALPGQHRDFGHQRGVRAGGRDGPVDGGDEGGAAGGGRGVSHADHAAGRPATGRGPGRRAHAKAQDPGDLERRRPGPRRPGGNPPIADPAGAAARCAGKTRCGSCCSRDSTSSTKSARAACCGACCGGSIGRCPVRASTCDAGAIAVQRGRVTQEPPPVALAKRPQSMTSDQPR